MNLEKIVEKSISNKFKKYISECFNPENARLYGTFQERAALNITQFPKIQGSLLIRMGLVYPIITSLVSYLGIPEETKTEIHGITINYHTWIAGYLAYVTEIQLGLSKYPIEFLENSITKIKKYFESKNKLNI